VGGHCIPKDPWLLAYSVDGKAPLRLIPAARAVNDDMPLHMADLTVQALQSVGCQVAGARVAVLGYAYLEDSDDTRNSPSEALVARLREWDAQVVIHDPWVAEYRGDVIERLKDCDAVVVMVAHRAYRALDLGAVKAALRTPILIDGRRVFDAAQAEATGLTFRSLGRGTVHS
jgi:UDP-N-acetyl-D-mannosaminuronic acid dehydrogenase